MVVVIVVVVVAAVIEVVTVVVIELSSAGSVSDVVVGVDEPAKSLGGTEVTETGSVDGSSTTSGCGSELELHPINNRKAETKAEMAWRVRTGENCTDIL